MNERTYKMSPEAINAFAEWLKRKDYEFELPTDLQEAWVEVTFAVNWIDAGGEVHEFIPWLDENGDIGLVQS